jgi:phenylacetate-CoA ligase
VKERKAIIPEESTLRYTAAERKAYLEKRLKGYIKHAYQNAPAIRARIDKVGVRLQQISTIKGLELLPILRKDDLIELQKMNPPFGGLISVPLRNLERVYVSPGPIFDPHHSSKSYWLRQVEALSGIGFRSGDVVVNTWSYHLVPAGLLVDEALRLLGATVIPMGVGNTELQVQVMHHFQATGFTGSSGFLMSILKKAEEMGYNVRRDLKVRVAYAGSEMGGENIRNTIRQDYGILCRDLYVTADLGIIAYECEEGNGMHMAQNVIVEIVNSSTGKQLPPGDTGEVVVTPFNEIYPLIRFGTGDLSTCTDEPCPCGRTSPKLARILGRVGEAVRVRSMNIHPRQLDPFLSRFAEISRYQAVITRQGFRDEVTLRVELASEEVDKRELIQKLLSAFHAAVRIKLDQVEFVSKGQIADGEKRLVDRRAFEVQK